MTAAILPDPDPALLKKLRLRIDTDDPQYPGWKKMKIRGKDLNDLPPEVFWLSELEVYITLHCFSVILLTASDVDLSAGVSLSMSLHLLTSHYGITELS